MSAVDVRFGFEMKPLPVRRCLFGKPNREILDLTLSSQDNVISKENDDIKRFRECWGLDIISGKPVDGGIFECTPIDPQSVPLVYSKGYAHRKTSSFRLKDRQSKSPVNLCALLSKDLHPLRTVRQPAKRRLPLDDDYTSENVNDENRETVVLPPPSSRVQCPIEPILSSPMSSPAYSDSSSESIPSPLSLQEVDHRTPKHQTTVKDFFPLHKRQRCSPKSSDS